MALSFECERCGAAGTVRAAEPGTPTLVKCSACGHTFITGGPLGAPKVQGGVRAPAVPVAPPRIPAARPPAPPPRPPARPPTPARAVAPLEPPEGPDRWTKTEISPDQLPPPPDGYVEFTLDDDPPAAPSVDPFEAPPRPAVGRAAPPVDAPVPFPRREPTREMPRPELPRAERTPAPFGAPPPLAAPPASEPSREVRAPAFDGVPPPPDRRWVPVAAVGVVGLLVGAVAAVFLMRDPTEAAKDAPVAAAPAPASPAAEQDPEPAREQEAAVVAEAAPVPKAAPAPAAPSAAAATSAPAAVAASEPKPEPARAAPSVRATAERQAPPPPPERAERPERTVARRAVPPEANVVPVPPAAPASKEADVATAVFTPPAEAPSIEDAPVYPSDGFRRPTATDPGCVQRRLRLPRDLQDRVPSVVPVRFAVGRDGSVSQFSVLADVPDRRVGEAIWDAIRGCSFNPGADARGRPVRLWVVMPIRFVGR